MIRLFRKKLPWQRRPRPIEMARLAALTRVQNGWFTEDKQIAEDEQLSELIGALFGVFGPLDRVRVTSAADWDQVAFAWVESIAGNLAPEQQVAAGLALGKAVQVHLESMAAARAKLLRDRPDLIRQAVQELSTPKPAPVEAVPIDPLAGLALARPNPLRT